VKLDPERTHFLGRVPRAQYIKVLQVSAAHVYLTYPFVLSWSLLEAMACGAPIVASDTAPVREVIRDGVNGRLVDFFKVQEIAQTALSLLQAREPQLPMRSRALADAQAFNRGTGLAAYDNLLGVTDAQLDPTRRAELNERERQLLQWLSAGHSNAHIAALRHRSPATVRNQISMLYQKLGVAHRAEAMAVALNSSALRK
jgi:DNA-binding NarL/FixJ family response regulator